MEDSVATSHLDTRVVSDNAHRPSASPLVIGWTLANAASMYLLAFGKSRVGNELGNPVLVKESRVTVIDGTLALAVLCGLLLTSIAGWWWVDPILGLLLAAYAVREARELLGSTPPRSAGQ